ncbi:MAG: hypothetical protein EOO78_33325 [Oxalobacteraceae bacterium]|nr:MAG: hypothetical protein EOO78_33325 [Oxalobacteraceae bacterium]
MTTLVPPPAIASPVPELVLGLEDRPPALAVAGGGTSAFMAGRGQSADFTMGPLHLTFFVNLFTCAM